MDKRQADAMAQAILEPDLEAQAATRRKHEAEMRSLAQRREVALLALMGMAIGAAVAYYAGQRFANGVIWGGVAGAVAGWLVAGIRAATRRGGAPRVP